MCLRTADFVRMKDGRLRERHGYCMASVQRRVSGRSVQPGRQAGNGYYVQGSTVRKLDIARDREKAEHMSAGYVLFLSVALMATAWILIGYIRLQSDITHSIENISKLENNLNDLRIANDEEYNRITSSIDLEEVRRIAIQELGMKYAEEGQIVTYESESSDYVKQLAPIPE